MKSIFLFPLLALGEITAYFTLAKIMYTLQSKRGDKHFKIIKFRLFTPYSKAAIANHPDSSGRKFYRNYNLITYAFNLMILLTGAFFILTSMRH
jgi:hypothetical protein